MSTKIDIIIQKIIKKVKILEKELEKNKQKLTKNNFQSTEAKLFIKGKFISFHEEQQALEILVNAHTNFYSIKDYYSQFLPFPSATVVIFSEIYSDGQKPKIFAITNGELEQISKNYTFVYKGMKNNYFIFYCDRLGYIKFSSNTNLAKEYNIQLSQEISFRSVNYGAKQFMIACDKNPNLSNRISILKEIKGS